MWIDVSPSHSEILLMCENLSVPGYRLAARRLDHQAPNGLLHVDWIALATSATQADGVLRAKIGSGWDVTLVAAGPAIMREAQTRGGLAVGFVVRL